MTVLAVAALRLIFCVCVGTLQPFENFSLFFKRTTFNFLSFICLDFVHSIFLLVRSAANSNETVQIGHFNCEDPCHPFFTLFLLAFNLKGMNILKTVD